MTIELSVIIPAFNAASTIESCLASIVEEEDLSFEVIIVNDGSTDETPHIINDFISSRDNFLLINQENSGISCALNVAINHSKGLYIARLDADDLNVPFRFSKQLRYLNEHQLDVCGTDMIVFDDKVDFNDPNLIKSYKGNPQDHSSLLLQMAITVPVFHPTVMFNKSIFYGDTEYYLEALDNKAEDYELWTRLSRKNLKYGNLKLPFLRYRASATSLSSINARDIGKQGIEIGYNYVRTISSKRLFEMVKNIINPSQPSFLLLDRCLIRFFILRPEIRGLLTLYYLKQRKLPLMAIVKELYIFFCFKTI